MCLTKLSQTSPKGGDVSAGFRWTLHPQHGAGSALQAHLLFLRMWLEDFNKNPSVQEGTEGPSDALALELCQ